MLNTMLQKDVPMKKWLLIIVVTILALTIYGIYIWNYSMSGDSAIIAINFTTGMAANQKNLVLKHVAPERAEQVKTWMRGHTKFECQAPFWDIDGTRIEVYDYTFKLPGKSEDKQLYNTLYLCRTNHSVYVLTIHDIKLVRLNDTWIITDWGEICEAYDYETCR